MISPAKKLARLSAEAYNRKTASAGGTEILISKVRKRTVIAFRGTEKDYGDILTDMREILWWSKEVNGFVHKGFLMGVRAIWQHLPIGGPNPDAIVLTGHSKGGAEAILCGAFMAQCGIPPVQIETFGAPRVGTSNLGKILNGIPGDRHRLGIDIVPTTPPAILPAWMTPYRHDRDLVEHDTDDRHIFENHRIADFISAVT